MCFLHVVRKKSGSFADWFQFFKISLNFHVVSVVYNSLTVAKHIPKGLQFCNVFLVAPVESYSMETLNTELAQ